MSAIPYGLPVFLVALGAGASACDAPAPAPPPAAGGDASGVTATWAAGATGAWALASAGARGAVAYVDADPETGSSVVRLQRLAEGGVVDGAATELGISRGTARHLALATDGDRYVACWSVDTSLTCASSPVAGGAATPGLSVVGTAPALAFAAGAWALAYRAAAGARPSLAVARIGSDATALGTSAYFGTEECGGRDLCESVRLAATKDAFVLVGASESGNVNVRWLDTSLTPISDPIDLGSQFWFYGSVVASGERAAVSLAEPYGFRIFLLDRRHLVSVHAGGHGGGNGKFGADVQLVSGGASFEMFWRGVEGVRHSPLDRAVESDFKIEPKFMDGIFGTYVALQLQDGHFFATREDGRIVVRHAAASP